MNLFAQTGPFVGREDESARLIRAIRDRRSLLIVGAADSGKTALVEQALSKLPWEIATRCLRVEAAGTLPRLLQQHVLKLFDAGDPVVQAGYQREGNWFRSPTAWVRKQTSGQLRSLLFQAFDRSRYWLFWDNVSHAALAHYHFLRETIRMRKTPAYLLARGTGPEYLGQAGRLFWSDEHRLGLGLLAPEDAKTLLAVAVEREGLECLDLDGFREQVLELSRGLPGAIVRMAAMAARPEYQRGKRPKTKLIYMDYLVELASRIQV